MAPCLSPLPPDRLNKSRACLRICDQRSPSSAGFDPCKAWPSQRCLTRAECDPQASAKAVLLEAEASKQAEVLKAQGIADAISSIAEVRHGSLEIVCLQGST